jgi:hypothetical protein
MGDSFGGDAPLSEKVQRSGLGGAGCEAQAPPSKTKAGITHVPVLLAFAEGRAIGGI